MLIEKNESTMTLIKIGGISIIVEKDILSDSKKGKNIIDKEIIDKKIMRFFNGRDFIGKPRDFIDFINNLDSQNKKIDYCLISFSDAIPEHFPLLKSS